ncbi:MAG TPA: MlaD family protein [Candidatus Acidoferrum sp.]|nr:MlaD family protein [Candidatus Acidoferrum sp.]
MAEITIRISDKALKITAGVLAAILLLWGVSGLWSEDVFRPKYSIHLFIPDATGLRPGAPVTLNGLDVGRVSEVKLASNSADSLRRVEVVLRIEKRFQNTIPNDSAASLISEGLLGDRRVDIERGIAGTPIAPGGEIRAIPTREITLRDMTTFMDNIAKVAKCETGNQNSPNNKPAVPAKSR